MAMGHWIKLARLENGPLAPVGTAALIPRNSRLLGAILNGIAQRLLVASTKT